MSFPLYKRAGYIAFLDDETDYLDVLGEVLPSHWLVRMFDNPYPAVEHLQAESKRLSDELWSHRSMIARSVDGESLIGQLLAYWHSDGTTRYTTTRLLVIDYSMPQQTGVEALELLDDWPGSRIMLTGQADELVAVNAFNRGLIQQYIPKQSNNLAHRIVDAITERLHRPAVDDLGKIWRNNLSREQLAFTKDQQVAAWLESLIKRYELVEYGVVGTPFGILGLDALGQAYWIQIEQSASTRSLEELADSLKTYEPHAVNLADIRSGQVITDFELQLALKTSVPLRCLPAEFMPQSDSVCAAVFTIDPAKCPGTAASLNALSPSPAGQ